MAVAFAGRRMVKVARRAENCLAQPVAKVKTETCKNQLCKMVRPATSTGFQLGEGKNGGSAGSEALFPVCLFRPV